MINGESVGSKGEGRETKAFRNLEEIWRGRRQQKERGERRVIKYLLSIWGGKKKKVKNE